MIGRIKVWINGPFYRELWRWAYACRMIRLDRCTWKEAFRRADAAIDLYSNNRWQVAHPARVAEFQFKHEYKK